MNIFDFIKDLADVEGNEAIQKFVMDFWNQASAEDRASIVLGIDQMQGHMRKVVKSFWGFCGIHITGDWVSIGGVSYAITPHRHVKGMNADFEGVMPGADQLIYDAMNAKANAETAGLIHPGQQEQMDIRGEGLDLALLDHDCLTSQCLTDKGRAALGEHKYPYKLTDMHGDRGVICTVIPDDQMPLDKEGNRAEIVINDSPCFKLPEALTGPRSLWNSLSGKEAPEGFNVTIPALMEGDVYHRTHVTSDNRVLHIAHDSAGNQAIYVCTQNGNTIMREVIMKNYNLLKSNHETAAEKYANTLSYENPKNKG